MIKDIKNISLVVCALVLYTFIGGVSYAAFDSVHPSRCHVKEEKSLRPEAHCHSNDGVAFGVLWPVMMPLWGAIEAGIRVSHFGMDAFQEITQ